MHDPDIDAQTNPEADPEADCRRRAAAFAPRSGPTADTGSNRGPVNGVEERAIRARVALAGFHHAELLVPGAVWGKVAYLDDGGCPVVLCARDMPFPAGRAGLRLALPGGGQLALIGHSTSDEFGVEDARRVGSILVEHRRCLTGLLDRAGAIPVRFEIETVLMSGAMPARPPIQILPAIPPEVVPLPAYTEAEPDLFDELGPSLGAHLTFDHQDLLIAVARRMAVGDDLLAVGVRDVSSRGLILDVVSFHGSTELPVRFSAPLDHPHQFGPALRTLAFERLP